ncbi:ABC transporter ATP-binding protein [uncultured Pseudodesulfovibrio sp.]|uniref:ABC transporter ATP-binding protein n=1 Tax=uncultured Pseudodesulfovibrio sp. TaxID=2035858 RepID=UPI0029C6ED71|nr:ABC transporter ATP-binding protein [uncultured Pseudodesulfovibrio sp.]
MTMPLLNVDNLTIAFGQQHVVQNVSFTVHAGETLAIVGESGSGKSMTARAAMAVLPPEAQIKSGTIQLKNTDMLTASDSTLCTLRGSRAAMIFQEPRPSLNPLHSVEKQIGETLLLHKGLTGSSARHRTLELLHMVGIDTPEKRLSAYPHELSGGQCQRIMIASALAGEPDLLIADEPTTALDVTVQRQILDLIATLSQKLNMATLLISHDLGLVRHYSHRVCVMQHGQIVEQGETEQIFAAPANESTQLLIQGNHGLTPSKLPPKKERLLDIQNLRVWFPIKKGLLKRTQDHVKAVDDVSLYINKGECLGIVGESGSGKTTLGLAALRMLRSTGQINFAGQPLEGLKGESLRSLRKRMQMVFQDPFSSLSPRMSIEQIVSEGLSAHHNFSQQEKDRRVDEVLKEVGLSTDIRNRYPHEFSGGQRQRIAIARALVLRPEFIVLDEPTSSLDRSVQFKIIELLRSLQEKRGLSYLFITHDLHLTRSFCHHVLVMRAGEIVEAGPTQSVFNSPKNKYTRTLLDAADFSGPTVSMIAKEYSA